MGERVPSWLISALVDALAQLGATASPDRLREEAESLARDWASPSRPAHNLRYLTAVLERLSDFDAVAPDSNALILGAAYLVTRPAQTWESIGGLDASRQVTSAPVRERLESLGVAPDKAARIHTLVEDAQRGASDPGDLESQLLRDALLETLGSAPQRYAKYLEKVREETASVSDEDYLRARKRFLLTVLGRNKIFLTPFATEWVEPVRENLLGELSAIDEQLGEDSSDALGRVETGSAGALLIIPEPGGRPETVDTPRLGEDRDLPVTAPAQERQVGDADEHLDETSTLESFEDPFSHRRRNRR